MSQPARAHAGLEFQNVSRIFEDRGTFFHLQDLSFNATPGSIMMIAGPSGSGKTTLLNLAAGLDLPDSGNILWGGQSIVSLGDSDRDRWRGRTVGYVFQHHLLPGGMTCGDAVAAPLLWNCDLGPGEALVRGKAMLEHVGLGGFSDRKVERLSGGQRQRVAIARALVCDPQVILADEPTAQLDKKTAASIVSLLCDHARETGALMLVVCHENQPGDWGAEQSLVLNEGALVG